MNPDAFVPAEPCPCGLSHRPASLKRGATWSAIMAAPEPGQHDHLPVRHRLRADLVDSLRVARFERGAH